MKRLLIAMTVFWAVLVAQAQGSPTVTPPPLEGPGGEFPVRFVVQGDSVRLGETFTLTVRASLPQGATVTEWPEFPEDGALEVLQAAEAVTEADGIITQESLAVIWEPGLYLSPELTLTYQSAGVETTVPVQSFSLMVPSSLSGIEEPQPLPSLPPVEIPYTPRWWYAAAAAVIGVVTFAIIMVIRAMTRGVVQSAPDTPTRLAIARLEDLEAQNLPTETVYTLVADQMRRYLKEQFGIDAVEMTTDELMERLRQDERLTKNHRSSLHTLLEQADLVKFAQFQPEPGAAQQLIKFAIRWLREVEREARTTDV